MLNRYPPSKQDTVTLIWDKTCFNCQYGSHKSTEPDCVECFKLSSKDDVFPNWRPYDRATPS